MIIKTLAAAVALLALYGIFIFVKQTIIKPLFWPLKTLPGPKSPSFFYGNILDMRSGSPGEAFGQWMKQYGPTLTYKSFMNVDRIFTTDLRAINHIFVHSNIYEKPAFGRARLGRFIGNGILVSEGEQHRKQRRIMNPSFTPNQVKVMTPIFLRKATQLRDIWNLIIDKQSEPQRIDAFAWITRTTLDIIGLAGFGYQFNSLNVNEEPSELNKALAVLLSAQNRIEFLTLLQTFVPQTRCIRTNQLVQEEGALRTMRRIGLQLIEERKQAILQDKHAFENDVEEGSGRYGHDLLSTLMKANMDTELPESQRLSDEEVLAQIPTFFIAGHETTSATTSWCLYALSTHPEIQSRLREELLSISTDTPSMDELSALSYLHNVAHETLRLHPSVPYTLRTAMKDDIIPLGEPYKGRDGKFYKELRVSEGDTVFVPILTINQVEYIWGKDAAEFNPDRWDNVPEAAKEIPGVWGNIATFIGGARGCIGYRFFLLVIKSILFILLRSFEFELAVPADDVYKRWTLVTRPHVRSEKEKGAQLPLIVKRYVK